MAGESRTTTDHDTIRKWAEERNGHPATVESTAEGDEPGILRIEFEQGDSDNLTEIDWDAFFEKFEEENLAFLYQEETSDGETSRFFKLVSR